MSNKKIPRKIRKYYRKYRGDMAVTNNRLPLNKWPTNS